MATITVRDLDESTRAKLKVRAARHGRSMEAEVREILKNTVAAEPSTGEGLGSRIQAMFAEIGGAQDLVDLIPRRDTESPATGHAGRRSADDGR